MNKEDLKKYELPKGLAEKLSIDDLGAISGGTYSETIEMALILYSKGYPSVFLDEPRSENGYINIVDDDKMKAFFAQKGYRFVPGKTEAEQDIYWKDGLPFGFDYILDLIDQGKF